MQCRQGVEYIFGLGTRSPKANRFFEGSGFQMIPGRVFLHSPRWTPDLRVGFDLRRNQDHLPGGVPKQQPFDPHRLRGGQVGDAVGQVFELGVYGGFDGDRLVGKEVRVRVELERG